MFVRALWIGALLAVFGCGDGPAEVELSVDLRTDFVPGVEFTGVRVELVGEDIREETLATSDSYVDSVRVADFAGLAQSERRTVSVTLLGPTAEVLARRAVVVAQTTDLAVTVVISRDCAEVACDEVGGVVDRCLGGRCVDPECVEGDEEACEDPECTVDGDCEAMASCARATCRAGVCLYDVDTSCGEDAYCDPAAGCTPLEPASCAPPVDETFTLMEGWDAGEGLSARPRELQVTADGPLVWVLAATRYEELGDLNDFYDAVLARIGCEGVVDEAAVIVSDVYLPQLTLASPPTVIGLGDRVDDSLSVLDRSTGEAVSRVVPELSSTPAGALPRGDGGFDVLLGEPIDPSSRRIVWVPLAADGSASAAPIPLQPGDEWIQSSPSMIVSPRLAVAYSRSDPGGASNAVDSVSVWTEALGPVPLFERAQTRRFRPTSLVWRGDDLWAAPPPRGSSAIEGIDGRTIRLYRVAPDGSVIEHELPAPPAGFGDYVTDLVALGADALAVTWIRRESGTGSIGDMYVRRVDIAGDTIELGPERMIPPVLNRVAWRETTTGFRAAPLPGEHLVVSWIEPGDDARWSHLRARILAL